jgi:replicative DNA helicase
MNVLEKTLPQNIDAEESVLGSLLLDRDAILKVAPFLRPADFYLEKNGWVYEAILDLYERREPTDIVTLSDELQRRGHLEAMGGVSYLTSFISAVPTAVHVEYYARIVERTATMRRLISAAGEIARIGYDEAQDIESALTRSEEIIFRVAERRATKDFVSLREVLDRFQDHVDHVHENVGQSVVGVPSGYIDMDKLLGGLQRSDLIILAARPSAGKTSLALNIVRHVAVQQRLPVAVFSVEMSADQLAHRMVSMESGIDVQRLRQGIISDSEWHHLHDAMGKLYSAPVYIDDTPAIQITELRSKARRIYAEQNVQLVVVDYLQLLRGRHTDNRVQEVSEISRSLKAVARELNVPVVALSQLSRAVETRQSHEPQLADLRESGSIEQDADVVLFIYRDELYNANSDRKGIADIILAKHRNGPIGRFHLRFFSGQTRFDNLDTFHDEADASG